MRGFRVCPDHDMEALKDIRVLFVLSGRTRRVLSG